MNAVSIIITSLLLWLQQAKKWFKALQTVVDQKFTKVRKNWLQWTLDQELFITHVHAVINEKHAFPMYTGFYRHWRVQFWEERLLILWIWFLVPIQRYIDNRTLFAHNKHLLFSLPSFHSRKKATSIPNQMLIYI